MLLLHLPKKVAVGITLLIFLIITFYAYHSSSLISSLTVEYSSSVSGHTLVAYPLVTKSGCYALSHKKAAKSQIYRIHGATLKI